MSLTEGVARRLHNEEKQQDNQLVEAAACGGESFWVQTCGEREQQGALYSRILDQEIIIEQRFQPLCDD